MTDNNNSLSLPAAVAVNKLTEKIIKSHKSSGNTLEPGSYIVDETIAVKAQIATAPSTLSSPRFKVADYLKPTFLAYASSLGESGVAWLEALLGKGGVLTQVIKMSPPVAMQKVPAEIVAIWDKCVADAKQDFTEAATPTKRAGNTTVVGEVSTGE